MLCRCAGSIGYSLFSCSIGTALMFWHIFVPTDSSVQMRLRGFKFQTMLCRCAGSVGYSLFSCSVGTALTFRCTFFSTNSVIQTRLREWRWESCHVSTHCFQQRIQGQVARMHRLIWVFARDIVCKCERLYDEMVSIIFNYF